MYMYEAYHYTCIRVYVKVRVHTFPLSRKAFYMWLHFFVTPMWFWIVHVAVHTRTVTYTYDIATYRAQSSGFLCPNLCTFCSSFVFVAYIFPLLSASTILGHVKSGLLWNHGISCCSLFSTELKPSQSLVHFSSLGLHCLCLSGRSSP